jgi:hypothetical protein
MLVGDSGWLWHHDCAAHRLMGRLWRIDSLGWLQLASQAS